MDKYTNYFILLLVIFSSIFYYIILDVEVAYKIYRFCHKYYAYIFFILVILLIIGISYGYSQCNTAVMEMNHFVEPSDKAKYKLRCGVHVFIENHIDNLMFTSVGERYDYVMTNINTEDLNYSQKLYVSSYARNLEHEMNTVITVNYYKEYPLG